MRRGMISSVGVSTGVRCGSGEASTDALFTVGTLTQLFDFIGLLSGA